MIKLDAVANREFLKDTIRQHVDFSTTDQARGITPPALQKPVADDAARIDLPPPEQWSELGDVPLRRAIERRSSRRRFSDAPLSLAELAYLLWTTQGVRDQRDRVTALRTVPSAGARHALETYLAVFRVEGLESAVYRYLPFDNQLVEEFHPLDLPGRLTNAALGQSFVGQAAATFIWTAIPYRMEWRYGPASHKVIALDAGHVCQNLYLACESIGCVTCAVAAYHQQEVDALLQVDGVDEFAVYLAPVGRP